MITPVKCDECGGEMLRMHCPLETCNWWRCSNCRAFGVPGKKMIKAHA